MTTAGSQQEVIDLLATAVGLTVPESYEWTRDTCSEPLTYPSVAELVDRFTQALNDSDLVIPDAAFFAKRCVIAVLGGHLVLQGPPGTGKTTVARMLAETFEAVLEITTATSDWTTFDVVGGLQPTASGALSPSLGCVTRAALRCAARVAEGQLPQATWLLIDEINRADIDKAIGPLYTVLSSITPDHLDASPLELWFESDERVRLWVPSRFRIIATMNDVDTSYVNAISQGLSRRFQFVFQGVPTEPDDIENEVAATFRQALTWYDGQSPMAADETLGASPAIAELKEFLQVLVADLREKDRVNWPVGSAQIADLWKSVLLAIGGAPQSQQPMFEALDLSITDRLVPQAGGLDDTQLDALVSRLEESDPPLPQSLRAVGHLRDTSSTL